VTLLRQLSPPRHLAQSHIAFQQGDVTADGILDVSHVWDVLRLNRRLIGMITITCLMLSAIAYLLIPAKYAATTILLADPRQQRVVQSETVLPGIGNDTAAVESQVEIIQSTVIAQKVIDELHLDQDAEFGGKSVLGEIGLILRESLGLAPPNTEMRANQIVANFEKNLKVSRRGLTYVIEVTFTSSSATKAATIANAIAKNYLQQQVTTKFDATSQASGWLNTRLSDLQKQASDAERAVANYKASQGLVETGDKRTLIDQQLSDLNQQLGQTRMRLRDIRAHYQLTRNLTADSVAANGLPEALQSPVVLALRGQYAQIAGSEAELAQIYGPKHPSLQARQAQLDTLKHQIANELARISAGLRNELTTAENLERSLDKSMTALKTESASVDQTTVRLRELERNAQATRTVLQQFLLRFKETSEQESLQVPDAKIVSPATPPLRPSYPNAAILLTLGGLGGLMLGVATSFVKERFVRGIRSADEAEHLLSLPVLVSLPDMDAFEPARPTSKPRRQLNRQVLEPFLLPKFRFAVDQPLSPFGKAIRDLAIRVNATRFEGSHVLLVTAAMPAEGTSLVAANLANVLARSGYSTLLIDADFRAPIDNMKAKDGLFKALCDVAPPLSFIRRETETGLSILPAGAIDNVDKASSLLTTSAMDNLLDRLKEKFDLIIIDAPPLGATVDSRYLLELADTALLVVAKEKAHRNDVRAALHAAGQNVMKFSGIVFNNTDDKSHR